MVASAIPPRSTSLKATWGHTSQSPPIFPALLPPCMSVAYHQQPIYAKGATIQKVSNTNKTATAPLPSPCQAFSGLQEL